jgi:hypothetical protein
VASALALPPQCRKSLGASALEAQQLAPRAASPSGVGRLSWLGGMRDGSVFTAVMRSVHKFSYGHKFERSAATPVVA